MGCQLRKYVTSSKDETQIQAHIENSDIIKSTIEIYKVMSFVNAHTVYISAFCTCIYAFFYLTYHNELTKRLQTIITLTYKITLDLKPHVSQSLILYMRELNALLSINACAFK